MFVSELITSVIQVLVFALIPFIVYLISAKSARGFLQYIGFYRPERRTVLYAPLASIFLFLFMWGALFAAGALEMLDDQTSVIGMLRAAGFSPETVLTLIVIAWVKTSLSEEIFFRGFLGKRLINRFGFQAGNLMQAAIFGVIHGILIALVSANPHSFWLIALIVFLSGAAGYIIGWLKEKQGNGSLIPGWIAHGLGNTIAYLAAFVL